MLNVNFLSEKDFWEIRPDRTFLSVSAYRQLMQDYINGKLELIQFLHKLVKPLDLNEYLLPTFMESKDMVQLALTFAFDDSSEISIDRFNINIIKVLDAYNLLEKRGFPLESPSSIYYPIFYANFEDHFFRCDEICLINSQETGIVLSTASGEVAKSSGFQPRNERFEKVVPLSALSSWRNRMPSVTLPGAPDVQYSVMAESAEFYLIQAHQYEVIPKGNVQSISDGYAPVRPPSHDYPYRFPTA